MNGVVGGRRPGQKWALGTAERRLEDSSSPQATTPALVQDRSPNDSIEFQYYDHQMVRDLDGSRRGETTIRDIKTTRKDTVGKNYDVVP
jgi:hypothetical protein